MPSSGPRAEQTEGGFVTGAVFESDDNAGSSHDADVDAAYDDGDEPATDLAAGSEDVVGDNDRTSHDADLEAAQED